MKHPPRPGQRVYTRLAWNGCWAWIPCAAMNVFHSQKDPEEWVCKLSDPDGNTHVLKQVKDGEVRILSDNDLHGMLRKDSMEDESAQAERERNRQRFREAWSRDWKPEIRASRSAREGTGSRCRKAPQEPRTPVRSSDPAQSNSAQARRRR